MEVILIYFAKLIIWRNLKLQLPTHFGSTDITITPFFLDQLTSQLQRRQTYVAFFAGLELNIVEKPIDPNPRVLMSRVITNVGRAYHASTGEFVAPVHGVYVLTAAISAQGRARVSYLVLHAKSQ